MRGRRRIDGGADSGSQDMEEASRNTGGASLFNRSCQAFRASIKFRSHIRWIAENCSGRDCA
ncbi:hypothetical protein BN2476_600033 [Paraburkholderia piptadeniae]|uniref:Uncharacterized protein n=1 Tax=Paraburkholderia piptadeniae TaxID=1701573 RepID=A0A1N7SLH9_9BURK|nr:hypothetical protein BN2476_600033 [Paraburkholderia piptadeniae]